jgi:hypothetical protein
MVLDNPELPWEENTYYKVRVSQFNGNPLHDSIFYVGFLEKDGSPGSYSGLMSHSEDFYWQGIETMRRKNIVIRKPQKLFTEKR